MCLRDMIVEMPEEIAKLLKKPEEFVRRLRESSVERA